MSAEPFAPYAWVRFWVGEGGTYILDEETQSFLVDPTGFFGSMQGNDVNQIKHWGTHRCVVLLGEPGGGKTTELRFWRDDTAATLTDGDAVVPPVVALGERDPQERLQETLGGDTSAVAAWREGAGDLHLSIDSIDEGRETIANIAASLPNALATWPIDRLLLRMTCRAADWPPLLKQRLRELWGAERVTIIRLAPLRAEDVLIAARAEGLPDPDDFLNRIVEQRVGPLAALPITLKLLIEEYRATGSFPATRAELFDRGCLRLVEEVNLVRVAAGWSGTLGARRRRDIASRLAALSLFSGRTSIGPTGGEGAALRIDEVCDDRGDDIHGTPTGRQKVGQVDRYWPKDEEDLSDWLARELIRKVAGTVVNREVQVRPRIPGVAGSGARTDVQLEAVARGNGDAETIGVIIEVKGDWHDEVETAMERQLRDDYLATTGYRHGIYVVGRFVCESWKEGDKKRAARRVEGTIEEVQTHFAAQATALSTGGVLLEAVVIDCGLSADA